MNYSTKLLYNLFILPVFYLVLKVLSIFNNKIKKGFRGRKKLFEKLIINFTGFNRKNKLIWVHASSMGEFEQAKPIIEELKKNEQIKVLATFFSPSGYENSLRYSYIDFISYLPFDTSENMSRFVNIVRPDITIIMRYDIWPNMIDVLNKNNVPVFLVDATMKKDSIRFKPFLKGIHKQIFSKFTKILTISEEDKNNFIKFGIDQKKIEKIGDTRFDRVYKKSLEAATKKLISTNVLENKKVIILGSSWEADESVLLPALIKLNKYLSHFITIIVPHEPTVQKLEELETTINKDYQTIRLSELNHYSDQRFIIVDSIGNLLSLYAYADIAYVGGSFKQGIHNVLEPAVYGIPVVFGPKIENSQEAIQLTKSGGGNIISNKKQAYRIFKQLLVKNELRINKGIINKEFINTNVGATQKIINQLNQNLLK